MVKFRKATPGQAYEVAEGVFSAEEAAKLGLAVVEVDATSQRPTAYGRYRGAPDGGPLGITTAQPADTEVVAGGTVSPAADTGPLGGSKGDIVNVDDPFIHGGTGEDTIHADGSAPLTVDYEAERREQTEVARKSIESASRTSKRK